VLVGVRLYVADNNAVVSPPSVINGKFGRKMRSSFNFDVEFHGRHVHSKCCCGLQIQVLLALGACVVHVQIATLPVLIVAASRM